MTTPLQRLRRMRLAFAKDQTILPEDYEHFITPDEPIPLSTAPRTSEAPRVPRAPKQS
jgi:hypothetical protein